MADTTGDLEEKAYEENRDSCNGYCATHCKLVPADIAQEKTLRLVQELHTVVFDLLKGIDTAKNAGGMQGMMARQMFPDIPTGS